MGALAAFSAHCLDVCASTSMHRGRVSTKLANASCRAKLASSINRLDAERFRNGPRTVLGRRPSVRSTTKRFRRMDGLLVVRAGDELKGKADRTAPEGDHIRAIVENVGRTSGHAPVIFLKMLDGSDLVLPVFIGEAECAALLKEIKHQQTIRPMTHDLMKSTVELLGYKVTHVIVTDMRDNTFYARVCYVSTGDGEKKELDIDARPSDAINLAVRFQAPIYVSKHVISSSAYLAAGAKDTNPKEKAENDEWFRKVQTQVARRRDPALELRSRLALAVAEERYDDAAKIRDQIGVAIGSDKTASLLYDLEQAVAEERFHDAASIYEQLNNLDEHADRKAKLIFKTFDEAHDE